MSHVPLFFSIFLPFPTSTELNCNDFPASAAQVHNQQQRKNKKQSEQFRQQTATKTSNLKPLNKSQIAIKSSPRPSQVGATFVRNAHFRMRITDLLIICRVDVVRGLINKEQVLNVKIAKFLYCSHIQDKFCYNFLFTKC